MAENPAVNYIVFPMETQGLKFYYQPPLNQEQQEDGVTCTETTCQNKDGKVVDFRPEEIVGSYAIYSNSKRDDFSQMGGKNYKTGKAFHIYRPKIKDSSGQEIWGNLTVDEQKQTLTLSIDQNWLNNASYPVTIDPDFGYTTEGLTEGVRAADLIHLVQWTTASDGAGTVTSMSFYHSNTNSVNGMLAVYNDNGSDYPGSLNGGSTGANIAIVDWLTRPVTATLANSTKYWLAHLNDTDYAYRYDSTTGRLRRFASQTYGTWADPYPGTDTEQGTTREISIYATYTPATPTPSLSPSLSEFRFNGLKMEGVKIQ